MRLTELAEKAYLSSKRECAAQLRQRFLSEVPSLVSAVTDVERMLKATTSGAQKHLPFSGIMQLAKDLQKEQKLMNVMWTSHGSAAPKSSNAAYNQVSSSPQTGTHMRSREFTRQLSPPVERGRRQGNNVHGQAEYTNRQSSTDEWRNF